MGRSLGRHGRRPEGRPTGYEVNVGRSLGRRGSQTKSAPTGNHYELRSKFCNITALVSIRQRRWKETTIK